MTTHPLLSDKLMLEVCITDQEEETFREVEGYQFIDEYIERNFRLEVEYNGI